jgi:hypothetical protein
MSRQWNAECGMKIARSSKPPKNKKGILADAFFVGLSK